jgi:serine/threonine protein kinase/Tfp pilus assembly protein PilF
MIAIPNEFFGRYKLQSAIGAGGMGEVFLAEDPELERLVALKILPAEFAENDDRVRRFVLEAKVVSALNHPNILTIYEIGTIGKSRYIASEYIKGETLRDKLKAESLSVSETLDIALQVALALEAAHEAGIIHRDIKPENIMLRADRLVKVLDFGLAKLAQDKPKDVDAEADTRVQTETRAGMILGTAAYMSPEQARGKDLDARTDIWSLGVVFYEMLAGRHPFASETVSDLIASILTKEPEKLREFNREISAELEKSILKTLKKNREERTQTVRNLLDDLTHLKKKLEFTAELNRKTSSGELARGDAEFTKTNTALSIAVLPFTNMSNDAENEFFCDGLAEELLNSLAKIEKLKVAARTSAFSFKGKNINVDEIGRALKVVNVLEGSVRKAGNRLRINVQLVNTVNGYHLWSERYDREMKDIFDVQDEIALAIVDSLKVKLLGEKKSAVLKRQTDNTEAYELFLKGRYYHNKYTEEGRLTAIDFFEKAIALDPDYASPYAGIALSLGISVYFGFRSPQETISPWRANANRALEIDPDLVEAHISHANSRFFIEWHWALAEAGFRRAIDLNSNSAEAHCWYGVFLITQNNYPQALLEGKRAVELDPLSLLANIFTGWIYLLSNHPNDAFTQVRKLIEIEPRYHATYWLKGSIYLAGGMLEEALEAYEKSLSLGGTQVTLSYLGCIYGLLGRTDEALRALDRLLEMRDRQYAAAIHVARIYSGLGDIDKAFEWLDKAVEERNGELVFIDAIIKIGTGNLLGRIQRDDSRFEDLLHRIGLPR